MQEEQETSPQGKLVPLPSAQPDEVSSGDVTVERHTPFQRLVMWFRHLFSPPAQKLPSLVKLRIARLAGDTNGEQTAHVLRAFKKRSGLAVRSVGKTLDPGPDEEGQEARSVATHNARRYLAAEDSDLLIWGRVDERDGVLDLYLTPVRCDEEDRPGLFGTGTRMILPKDFDDKFAVFLATATLSAASQGRGPRLAKAQALLATVFESVRNVDHDAPNVLTAGQRAVDQIVFATLTARLGVLSGRNDWMTDVLDTFELALKDLPESDLPIERGLTLRGYAGLLLFMVERKQSLDPADSLEKAEEALREALKLIDNRHFPEDWAAIQDRLGHVLYRRDEEDVNRGALREAVSAYQAALHVFTKTYYPLRWANLMNSLSQALQVLGEQLRSPEVLKKAVLAAYSALEVRTQDVAPYSWAASQNNLGSALYLLSRSDDEEDLFEEAHEAFTNALDFYQSQGQENLETVTRRNLEKLEVELGQPAAETTPNNGSTPQPKKSNGDASKKSTSKK